MNQVRDYFKKKYDKTGPAYLQGVLRTIDKLPEEDEETVPDHDAPRESEVVEK
jgi:hypothetical protein